MNDKEKDSIFYFCSLIEYIARITKNHRGDVIKRFNKAEIIHQLKVSDVNHCLPFEQVADELIEMHKISDGSYDTISKCKYTVPSYIAIGRVYQMLICSVTNGDIAQTIMDVFSSFISDEISDFNSNVYYSNPDYLRCSYLDGELLA